MRWFESIINHNVVEVFCSLAWVVLLLPALVYLGTTWRNRRRLLLDRLGPDAIKLYYKQFYPSTASKRAIKRHQSDIKKQFKSDFNRLYGRRHYLLPLLLLGIISALGLIATSRSVHTWLGWSSRGREFPAIAISSFLGGYAWVLYDQFRRFRTGDFTAHDVYGGLYRFLIVIPLGISLAALMKDTAGVPIAFLMSAFPTTTLFTLARRLANQKLGLGDTQEAGSLELEKLQCVGKSNAERYMDEGITTISELAWTDPVELTIKTNRDFNFVVDSVSQALLWVYFEEKVRQLYPLSLRGAQEVCSLLDDLDSKEPKLKAAAEENLKKASAILELDRESLLYTLICVRDDPYAQFLFNVWA